jgi:hypothetical protein
MWWIGGTAPSFLTSALGVGASILSGKVPSTQWTGGYVGPGASLKATDKKKQKEYRLPGYEDVRLL